MDKRRTLKEEFLGRIEGGRDGNVSFEDFPYYLSESTRSLLLTSTFIHLKRVEYATRYTTGLSAISPRILITGPPGSEIYQEHLVKALANHYNAKFLVFDSTSMASQGQNDQEGPKSLLTTDSLVELRDKGIDSTGAQSRLPVQDAEMSKNFVNEGQLTNNDARKLGALRASIAKLLTSLGSKGTSGAELEASSAPSNPEFEALLASSNTVGPDNTQSTPHMRPELGRSGSASSKLLLKEGDRVKYAGRSSVTGAVTLVAVGGFAYKGDFVGCRGKVVFVSDRTPTKVGVKFDKPVPGANSLQIAYRDDYVFHCQVSDLRLEAEWKGTIDSYSQKMMMDILFEVLDSESRKNPFILFIREVGKLLSEYFDLYTAFRMKLEKLEGSVVVIGSHTMLVWGQENSPAISDRTKDTPNELKMLSRLFPCTVSIQEPQDEEALSVWKRQLKRDMETLAAQSNRFQLLSLLNLNNLDCEDLESVEIKDQTLTHEFAGLIVGWAVSKQLMTYEEPPHKKHKLVLSADSLQYGWRILQGIQNESCRLIKSLKDVVTENDMEEQLLTQVIPASEIGVKFEDIGALETVKQALQELVMLPLQRPELFCKGQLKKPCKGILLFGPPGTGKTMLAKAVATEAGANFINISMSSIVSKWFGQGEKYVKAVFTLASKISPSIIFVDEVDSMLGRRDNPSEHDGMRRIKNEFMANWDGLRTKDRERVLVLAASNRPFDLDEAVVRRLPRRLMVNLPDESNRAKILKVILANEDLRHDVDLNELAGLTEGYSGSDLKNLCVTAAYRPIREILEKENDRERAKLEIKPTPPPIMGPDGSAASVRSLSMEDLRLACQEVCASISADAASMTELLKWNEHYGEGGSRHNAVLSYFM